MSPRVVSARVGTGKRGSAACPANVGPARGGRARLFQVAGRGVPNGEGVEDIVRDVAVRLNGEERVLAYVVEAENFESIHNHSAYALIEKDKEAR